MYALNSKLFTSLLCLLSNVDNKCHISSLNIDEYGNIGHLEPLPLNIGHLENEISQNLNPYLQSTSRQYGYSDPNLDIGATATLLVGGAALLGAIGIVGVSSMQGYRGFDDRIDVYMKKDDCCKDLEHKLRELQKDLIDEQDDIDILENRQRGLCNLANQLSRINIDNAAVLGPGGVVNPAIFNGLVATVNEIVGALNPLVNAGCNGI